MSGYPFALNLATHDLTKTERAVHTCRQGRGRAGIFIFIRGMQTGNQSQNNNMTWASEGSSHQKGTGLSLWLSVFSLLVIVHVSACYPMVVRTAFCPVNDEGSNVSSLPTIPRMGNSLFLLTSGAVLLGLELAHRPAENRGEGE